MSERSAQQTRESADMRRQRRAGRAPRSRYPSRGGSVDPTIMRGRRLRLPQEICPAVAATRLRRPRGTLIAGQKSSEAIVAAIAGKFPDDWCRQTMRSRTEPMKKIARSLRNHHELILNYFRAQKLLSSGVDRIRRPAPLSRRRRGTEILRFHLPEVRRFLAEKAD